tara:strand:+ start:1272 stop:2453 length:1182 start_codon:yes stop_codon:yes gene_type:complete
MRKIDIVRARAETPGVQNVLHFNNAGAGLMPQPVLDALTTHLQLEANIGGYEAAAATLAQQKNTYNAIARLLNAKPEEIALVENATVGWLMAFHAMIKTFKPGDKILTIESEYATNYITYLQVKREYGLEIVVAPSDETGSVDVAALESLIDDRVKLISMTHIPTNGGLVNPAAAVGVVAKKAGVLYLLDACQSAGQVPLDVAQIGCDALSVTGRKYLRGPRGTGFLYIREDLANSLEPPFLDLHSAKWTGAETYEVRLGAKRFENWEFYVAGVIGLGVAVDYALSFGMDAIHARLTSLAEQLRTQLSAIPGVHVTDIGREKAGIVTFIKDGFESPDIRALLSQKKINVSSSNRNSTLLDMDKRGLAQIVRSSVHYYNDEDEIARFCEAVEAL